ncbi:MAG: KUP/HAK/KT family potassium transporter [Dehalococcoidia bacterium]
MAQVYLGAVNYVLMATCVGVVFAFGSSSNLAAAYGVAVTTTMVITSGLLYVVMRYRWGWSIVTAATLTTVFLAIDLAFFAANIIKVPEGGWFPLAIGLGVLLVMLTWKTGRERLTRRIRSGELATERFIGSIARHPQRRVPGTAVYLFSDLGATPPPLLANLRHNEVLHETILIVTVEWATTPRVQRAKRATVHSLGEGFYQVLLRYGFTETPEVPGALAIITTAEFGFDPDDAVYVVGNETVIPRPGRSPLSLRDRLFALMHRNATSPVRFFGLPPERVIEVGTQVAM